MSNRACFRPGEMVCSRYRIERFFDSHGIEQDYLVSALADGKKLLLKVFVWPASAHDWVAREVAGLEAQVKALSGLRHPGVAPIYEVVPLDDAHRTLCFREPVEWTGKPLPDFVAGLGRPLREAEVADIASQLSEALDTLHHTKVLHLALSSRRVVVFSQGDKLSVKLTDAGLYTQSLAAHFAEPGYLAPEVLSNGNGKVDARADQFSLAVVLYELLAGQAAFVGSADESRELIVQRVLHEDPLPVALQQKTELALQRALSRTASVRFPSLRDFVLALGGSVARFPQTTRPHVRALQKRQPSGWGRLGLPMAQGALWALCGLALVLGLRGFFGLKGPRRIVKDKSLADLSPDSLAAPADLPLVVSVGPKDPFDLGKAPDVQNPQPTEQPPELPTEPLPKQPPKPPATPPSRPVLQPNYDVQQTLVSIESQAGTLNQEQQNTVRGCVRLVPRPTLPYRVVLEKIGGRLLVSPNGTSPEFQMSSDFRDCLKLRIGGIVEPKVVTISGKTKGRAGL